MEKMNGQTLAELMICLLIGGVMLSTAIPAFTSISQRNQQTQIANQLLGALHYARGAAVMGRKTIALCSGGTICGPKTSWQNQMLIFDDHNLNGQLDSGEHLLQQLPLTEGYNWNWSNFRNRPYLQFEADGTTRALNGTFTLCHGSTATYQIVINVTGRARAQKAVRNAYCS